MRSSVKRHFIGLVVAGVFGLTAAGASANGNGNGPDAYIGIVGGSPQERNSQAYNYEGGGYRALGGNEFDRTYRYGHSGFGTYKGGYGY